MSGPASSAPHPEAAAAPPSKWSRVRSSLELFLSLGVASAVLAYILIGPKPSRAKSEPRSAEKATPAARVIGPKRIEVQLDSPLGQKLQIVQLQTRQVSAPVLTVTGTVVASRRPGPERTEPYWQFDRPELLTLYADWKKALADIAFQETQLTKQRELATAKQAAQQKVVERLKKLVAAGTEAGRDLATEETSLAELKLQALKADYESETAIKVARRASQSLALQLQQAGIEPVNLQMFSSDVDLVTAEVPEGQLRRVRNGQKCEARFFGLPDDAFSSMVSSIAPVLSSDRRTLRALFIVDDPNDKLRPGMFAEIGLGTEPHESMLIPATGVIHIGRTDYVLVSDGGGTFEVRIVDCGELHGEEIEIVNGLRDGDKVIGMGAILLKPLLVLSLSPTSGADKSRGAPAPEEGAAAAEEREPKNGPALAAPQPTEGAKEGAASQPPAGGPRP